MSGPQNNEEAPFGDFKKLISEQITRITGKKTSLLTATAAQQPEVANQAIEPEKAEEKKDEKMTKGKLFQDDPFKCPICGGSNVPSSDVEKKLARQECGEPWSGQEMATPSQEARAAKIVRDGVTVGIKARSDAPVQGCNREDK